MSSEGLQSQVDQLRGLVKSLTLQVARVDSELEEVRDRCYKLEGDLVDYKLQREFELVEQEAHPTSSPTPPSSGSGIAVAPTSSTTPLSSGYSTSAASPGVPEERVEVARSVGVWILRCLQDLPRGSSGRNKIKEGSNFYLVIRTVDGVEFNPPKVLNSWKETKAIVSRGSGFGNSIFVGLPTKADARLALETAKLKIPSALLAEQ